MPVIDTALPRDLTDPDQGPHALQLLIDDLTQALGSAWRIEARVIREDPVVSIGDNGERLGYPPDAVTGDARYTRYLDDEHVLRSSTTAMIPSTLRKLATTPPERLLLAPAGACYRRDSVDWQHTDAPHQMDLWRLDSERRLDVQDLVEMIELVTAAVLPGMRWRTVPATHPYTTHGRQIDVRSERGWVEVGECGLASPTLLSESGLDRHTGLAMGLGLDRILMLRKGIPDIRLLRSADPRIARQMLDLSEYHPVSHQPLIRRDLSIAVDATIALNDELLGDQVRDALGPDADVAETVRVLAETDYHDLPEKARMRLGIRPYQRNVLIRLELRSLERTLTDAEANQLRNRVYSRLHEGTAYEWS